MKHTSGLSRPLAFVTRESFISADGSTQPYPVVTGAAAVRQLAAGLLLKSFLRADLVSGGPWPQLGSLPAVSVCTGRMKRATELSHAQGRVSLETRLGRNVQIMFLFYF